MANLKDCLFENVVLDEKCQNLSGPEIHPVQMYVQQYSMFQCGDHERQLLEYWCRDDDMLVCKDCLILGSHHGHKAVAARGPSGNKLNEGNHCNTGKHDTNGVNNWSRNDRREKGDMELNIDAIQHKLFCTGLSGHPDSGSIDLNLISVGSSRFLTQQNNPSNRQIYDQESPDITMQDMHLFLSDKTSQSHLDVQCLSSEVHVGNESSEAQPADLTQDSHLSLGEYERTSSVNKADKCINISPCAAVDTSGEGATLNVGGENNSGINKKVVQHQDLKNNNFEICSESVKVDASIDDVNNVFSEEDSANATNEDFGFSTSSDASRSVIREKSVNLLNERSLEVNDVCKDIYNGPQEHSSSSKEHVELKNVDIVVQTPIIQTQNSKLPSWLGGNETDSSEDELHNNVSNKLFSDSVENVDKVEDDNSTVNLNKEPSVIILAETQDIDKLSVGPMGQQRPSMIRKPVWKCSVPLSFENSVEEFEAEISIKEEKLVNVDVSEPNCITDVRTSQHVECKEEAVQDALTRDYILSEEQGIEVELWDVERSRDISPGKLATLIVGFLNSEIGGVIFLGVARNSLVRGVVLDRGQRDKVRQMLDRVLSNLVNPRVAPRIVDIDFIPVEEGDQRRVSNVGKRLEVFVVRVTVMGRASKDKMYMAHNMGLEGGVYTRKGSGPDYNSFVPLSDLKS